MLENVFSISSNNASPILPFIFESQESINLKEKYKTNQEEDIYYFPKNQISQISNNLNDLSFLLEKFDELREKEINGNITEFEQILLYEVIEKQISDFPNPHLPSDHEEATTAIKSFKLLKRQNNKKYKNKKTSGLFSLFSWLG